MEDRFRNFTLLIAGIHRCIKKIKSMEMAGFKLKSPHVSCLYYLYVEGELTARQLCKICEEDKAAISRSLEYLEENGLIYCDSSLKKRYNSLLSLTERGREVGARIDEIITEMLLEASMGLEEGEREKMYASLSLIYENLQTICNRYGE